MLKGEVGTCPVCKNGFTAIRRNQKSCSTPCSNELWKIGARANAPPRSPVKKGAPSPIRIERDTAFIWLREGFETAIDAADLPIVEGKRWRMWNGAHGHCYAGTGYTIYGNYVPLHRLLMDTPSDMVVDHIDGDGLNNRRVNLRNCTSKQNMGNRLRARLGMMGHIPTGRKKYRATIKVGAKIVILGSFETQAEANAAYKGAAKLLRGEFAPE